MILNNLIPFLLLALSFNPFVNCEGETTNETVNSNSITTPSLPTTDSLPTIILTARQNKVFDYEVTVGQPNQTMFLRLDMINAYCWLPAVDGFTVCPPESTETATATGTQAIPVSSSSSTESQSTDPAASSSSSSVCSDQGIYDIYNSSTGSFWSFQTSSSYNDSLSGTPIYSIFANYIYVSGYYATDAFEFAIEYSNSSSSSIQIDSMLFINANDSNVSTGGLGVGLADEGVSSNFLEYFKSEGIIDANAYSLSLVNEEHPHAELILGGLSTSKYIGDLCLFDFIPVLDESTSIISTNGGYSEDFPIIPISGFGVTSVSGKSVQFSSYYDDAMSSGSYPRPAMLDTRTFYNYIPYSTLIEIAVELSAYYADELNRWLVDCSIGSTGSIDIYLANQTINMPISDLLYPATASNGSNYVFQSGDPACYLAFLPDYQLGYSMLGSPFLRNIYLAVDNEARQLAIAPIAASKELTARPTTSSELYSSTIAGTTIDATSTDDYGRLVSLTTSNPPELYAITSGYIPFAKQNNFTNYGELTLVMPSSINASETVDHSSQAFISNGEVFIGTHAYTYSASASKSFSNTAAAGANQLSVGFNHLGGHNDENSLGNLWMLASMVFGLVFIVNWL